MREREQKLGENIDLSFGVIFIALLGFTAAENVASKPEFH